MCFRAGIFIGKHDDHFTTSLGINLSSLVENNASGKVYYMKEYIKVREIDNIMTFVNRPQILKIDENNFLPHFDEGIELLEEDEKLFINHYFGLGARARVRPFQMVPFASVTLAGSSANFRRTLITKKEKRTKSSI